MAYSKKKKEGAAWQSKGFRIYNDILQDELKKFNNPELTKRLQSILELSFYDGYVCCQGQYSKLIKLIA